MKNVFLLVHLTLRLTDLSIISFFVESDEFDDVIPPPAPVLSIPSAARPDSRKMSLGILEIVGGSTAFSVGLF